MKTLEINNLENNVAYCEAMGLSKCFAAYADNCAGDDILEIGFNENSGYTYIALESGITICSMLGNDVEYIVYADGEGTENFFSNYKEATEFSYTI